MNESSNDAQMEHPDLDQAEKVDDHGPAFDAAYEGLDDDDDAEFADGR
jgi:hypothetical protein